MTKYRWIDTPKKHNEDYIRNAIRLAINAPIVNPRNINIWHLEELKRFDNRIKDRRRLIGSYLK